MKRTSILAIGFGMLLGFGMLTPGCGSDSDNGKKDSSVDTKKADGSVDGPKGTGGALAGTGGALGAGGATVIPGSGGRTGAGGATTIIPDGGRDAIDGPPVGRDVAVERTGDTRDVPILPAEVGIEAPRVEVSIDKPADVPPPSDVAMDGEPVVIDGSIDTQGVDGGID
jgi:hypothetical protein